MAPFKQSNFTGKTNTSYFTKDSSVLTGGKSVPGKLGDTQKYLNRKRQLYTAIHEVPCFNLKYADAPILLSFKFSVFRMNNNKKKIFIGAILLPG